MNGLKMIINVKTRWMSMVSPLKHAATNTWETMKTNDNEDNEDSTTTHRSHEVARANFSFWLMCLCQLHCLASCLFLILSITLWKFPKIGMFFYLWLFGGGESMSRLAIPIVLWPYHELLLRCFQTNVWLNYLLPWHYLSHSRAFCIGYGCGGP